MNEKSSLSRKELGRRAEEIAAQYVQDEHYGAIVRNWRCRTGELDIVAEQDGVLVFIEVRSRRQTGSFGTPEESVDLRKQRQVRSTAEVYMQQNRMHGRSARFDVITVRFDSAGQFLRLDHYPNAF